jgi:hypothetical protein
MAKPRNTGPLAGLAALTALTREMVAEAENISLNTLEELHRRGEAPPRYRVGHRWNYPPVEYLGWRQKKLAEAERAPTRKRKRAVGRASTNNEVIA